MTTHTTLTPLWTAWPSSLALSASAAFAEQPPRLPQPPPGTVTLSLAEYDRLVDRAERPARRADPPPIPAIVARSDGQFASLAIGPAALSRSRARCSPPA